MLGDYITGMISGTLVTMEQGGKVQHLSDYISSHKHAHSDNNFKIVDNWKCGHKTVYSNHRENRGPSYSDFKLVNSS